MMGLCRGEFQCNDTLGQDSLSLSLFVCVSVWRMNETSRFVQDCRFTCACSLCHSYGLLPELSGKVKLHVVPGEIGL